jgi:hypothetical protein
MLGDITPQSIKIDQQAVTYPGRDHVNTLTIKRFDGRSYKTVDTSALTRVVLAFPGTDPVIAYDSDTTPAVFSWSGSAITIDLSDYSMPASIQTCYLIAYDAEHPNGQVLVDNNDSVLAFDFRNISAAGILQPPVIELISEAPVDGETYGRKNGAWVLLAALVSGVASVNGQTGEVVLDTDDIDEGAVNLYHTTARAAAAAPVQSVNGSTGAVVLDAADVEADPSGTAAAVVEAHVADTTPHEVIVGVDRLGFDMAAGLTAGDGELVWNDADKTLDLGLPGGVMLQVGQEFLIRGVNKSGVPLADGTAVYISGAQGNRVVFSLADASQAAADKTIGVLTQSIANNAEGFCTIAGLVRGTNTSAWAEGSELWLSATTAGALTNVRAPAPNNAVRIGIVVRSHATLGAIFIRVQIIESMNELQDVVIIAPQDGDIIEYDTATSTWVNVPNTGGSGETNTASNVGTGVGVFAQKVAADLQFKSLVAGAGVTLTASATEIEIVASGAGGAVDSVNGATGAVVLDTDDIGEGATNLYFTNVRASAAAPVQTVDGQTGAVSLTASYAPLSHVGDTGAAHGNAVAGGAAGFMTGADKTKLNGIATGANLYVHPNHSGDVTSAGDGAQTIANNAVTNAKAADMAVNTIKGRITAGTGDPEDLTATQVRTVLNVADGAVAPPPIITESTTARVLALTDANTYIRHTNASASTVTVAPQSSVAWAASTEVYIRRAAAGNLTLTPGSGVTLNAPSGGTLVLTNGMSVGLKRVAENVWDVIGQTVAA